MDRPYSKLPKITKPNVFVAIPMSKYTILHVETAAFCSGLNANPDVIWGYVGAMSPEFSRNALIEHHFHNDPNWTHIFFIDSDVVPPRNALHKMLGLDADVVTGAYPLNMSSGLFWSVGNEKNNWIPMHEDLPKEPFETASCGGGCLLIRREVLTAVKWPWFKTKFQEIYKNDGRGLAQGEDVYFCKRAIEEGFKVIADPSVICKHFNDVDMLKIYNDIKQQISTGESKAEKV